MTDTPSKPKARSRSAAGAKAQAAKVPLQAARVPVKPARPRGAKAAAKPPAAARQAPAAKEAPATSLLKKVSERNRKNVSAALEVTREASFRLIDSQRAIWLAGLGALAQASVAAGKRGEKAFQSLVKAGEALEAQAKSTVETGADRLKEGIGAATGFVDQGIARAGDAFDSRVEQALDRLGFPKGDAFKELYDRLEQLSKALEKNLGGK